MARPRKMGLNYFPFDVDIFEDDKLFDVQNEYGPIGEIIYIRLLCMIYRNGYYLEFDNMDKLSGMLIKSIGNRWIRDKKVVSEVIPFLAKCNLFSSELMLENVLTSRSIQRRYLEATGRRQQNIEKYWLLEENEGKVASVSASKSRVSATENKVSVYNNSVNVSNNATNKSKVNESKVKESKVVVTLPLLSGGEQVITEDDTKQLQLTYKNIDVITSLRKLALYVAEHPDKRRSNYSPYIALWLNEDDKQRASNTKNAENASYNLEEYERYSMFDDE